MTPEEVRTAADDLDRLEELEPRPGRVGLANRLRRGAEWLEQSYTSQNVDSSRNREVRHPADIPDTPMVRYARAWLEGRD